MNTSQSLNADQQAAVSAVAAFIVSGKKQFFMTGRPGVGKTFTTTELALTISKILQNYHNAMGKTKEREKKVHLTSTTNKAARVLTDETGIKAKTIHSFLGVTPKKDYNTQNMRLVKSGKWRVHSDIILIVDEAPMMNTELFNLIHEATDSSCKIIYVGDKNQLPPVKETTSPVSKLSNDPSTSYEITTPVRNAGSPALQDLCERLLWDITNETPKDKLTHWRSVPGVIEHLTGDQAMAFVTNTYGPGGIMKATDADLKGRILSYTNAASIGYNKYIRGIRGLPVHPSVGEVLIANQHLPLGRGKGISVEDELTILNVAGPNIVGVDAYNNIEVYDIEASTHELGVIKVQVAADVAQLRNLQSHFKKLKQWRSFHQLNESFVDLRDREASTVHKAQGSTYDFVLLDMDDIFKCRDVNQLRRMLYVCASRPRSKIYVYDKGIATNQRGIYR